MTTNDSKQNPYPARSKRQAPIARIKRGRSVWISGRLLSSIGGGLLLRDASGAVSIRFAGSLEGDVLPGTGDIVDLHGVAEQDAFVADAFRLLAPGRAAPPAGSPNSMVWELGSEPFVRRRRVRNAVRDFFDSRGFLEVETPCLRPAAGQEPHLDPFRTTVDTPAGERDAFLITSPEYCHKRLLTAGREKIYEISRTFRNGPEEGRDHHWYEFVMLEWYRAFASCIEIMNDVEELLLHAADAVESAVFRGLAGPFRRLPVKDAFRDFAGVDLEPFLAGESGKFARENEVVRRFGLSAEDSAESRFFKIFLGAVEPGLEDLGPVFLVDYPASQAALAKIKEGDDSVSERFELYACGVELANGFTELNDPVEQRRRFEEEACLKRGLGHERLPFDEAFLEALALGMPPAGGVALGFDRLMMILYGEKSLAPFLPFRGGF